MKIFDHGSMVYLLKVAVKLTYSVSANFLYCILAKTSRTLQGKLYIWTVDGTGQYLPISKHLHLIRAAFQVCVCVCVLCV